MLWLILLRGYKINGSYNSCVFFFTFYFNYITDTLFYRSNGSESDIICPFSIFSLLSQVEDAFTLGRLFSHLTNRSQIHLILSGYDQIRQSRTHEIEQSEMASVRTIGMPPGPHRDSRNQALRMTLHLEGADDETLARAWADYLRQFNYDAKDAVDEWWLNWAKPVQAAASAAVLVNGDH